MNKQQVIKLIKLSHEFDEQLNQFDEEYFEDKDIDNLNDYDTHLANCIDDVYKSLINLRMVIAE